MYMSKVFQNGNQNFKINDLLNTVKYADTVNSAFIRTLRFYYYGN